MPYCSHYSVDTDEDLDREYCNPCFGNIPGGSNEIVYYPTGEKKESFDFLDFYIKDFVMGILPPKYAKRIRFDKEARNKPPHAHAKVFCYPAIHLISTGLSRKEFVAILQMFRYPFEWSTFETTFVRKMQEGYLPTDAWIMAHGFDNPDHGLLDYQSLCNRTTYKPGTYNLTTRFLGLSNSNSIFANFRLEV